MTTSVQILSDAHLEFGSAQFPRISKEADIIILAGDIDITPAASKHFFKWIRQKTKAPIVYVLGNHEYYYQTYPTVLQAYKDISKQVSNVYVLEQDTVILKNVRFLGTTLWTWLSSGLGKYIEKNLNDYNKIRVKNTNSKSRKPNRSLVYQDVADAWVKAKNWLTNQLAEEFDGPTIIVTHHAPSERSVTPEFYNDLLNEAYFSNLEPLIQQYQPSLWVHGHMHDMRTYNIDKTLVICNPRGYPSQYGNNGFVDKLVIDIE